MARNRALHYLSQEHTLSHGLRHQLTEVVNGYVGRCGEDAARGGRRESRQLSDITSASGPPAD
jgi:hypothetical protein